MHLFIKLEEWKTSGLAFYRFSSKESSCNMLILPDTKKNPYADWKSQNNLEILSNIYYNRLCSVLKPTSTPNFSEAIVSFYTYYIVVVLTNFSSSFEIWMRLRKKIVKTELLFFSWMWRACFSMKAYLSEEREIRQSYQVCTIIMQFKASNYFKSAFQQRHFLF